MCGYVLGSSGKKSDAEGRPLPPLSIGEEQQRSEAFKFSRDP
jgi:hypothetical protein